jgi:integrase
VSACSVATHDLRTFDPLRDKSYQSTGLGRDIADYLARKTTQGRAARTVSDKERYLATLALMFPSKGVADLSSSDVDHWLARQPAGSRRHRGSHVRDFFNWARRFDLIETNPFDRLDPIKPPPQKTFDIFLDAEIEQLAALPHPDGPLMLCLFDAGLRKGEARALQGRHVIPEPVPGQLRIVGGKGGKDRLVPLTNRLSRALAELALTEAIGPKDFFWYKRPGGHRIARTEIVNDTSMQIWWARSLDAADVRYRNLHLTRHTFATRYLRSGGRLTTLTQVMGHSSGHTTSDLYAHLDTRDVALDIALLEA